MKELSDYDFKFRTKDISNKNISAAELFEDIYGDKNLCFLYESLESSGQIGRYSIMGGDPFIIFKAKNYHCEVNIKGNKFERHENPFNMIKSILKSFSDYPDFPPFSGGAVGYVSYDSIRYIEKIPDNNPEDPKLPDQYFIFPSEIIVVDNEEQSVKIIVYGDNKEKIDKRIGGLYSFILNFSNNNHSEPGSNNSNCVELLSSFKKEEFEKAVLKSKRYIKEGEIFQVVLSQRFEFKVKQEPFDVYKKLRVNNPSPYMYFMKLDELYLIGSSPEILIKLKKGIAVSRPIAGTRKRGETDEEDKMLEKELISDEKELAEHIMLVDLARNDLGRVCKFGSVRVDELMRIEKYSKVMHIVSNIVGKLKNNYGSVELFKATFPAGTVSGAPKIRAMEIIDELESVKRGIYAGGVGYFAFNGDLDFCIAIRTIIIKGEKGFAQVGAGIVADSIPENEYNEILNKAKALILTLMEEE